MIQVRNNLDCNICFACARRTYDKSESRVDTRMDGLG